MECHQQGMFSSRPSCEFSLRFPPPYFLAGPGGRKRTPKQVCQTTSSKGKNYTPKAPKQVSFLIVIPIVLDSLVIIYLPKKYKRENVRMVMSLVTLASLLPHQL